MQLSFCLLLYDLIQVVRGFVAVGQGHAPEVISTELLFADAAKQLVGLHELVATDRLPDLLPAAGSAAALRQHLHRLLGRVWSECWVKSPAQQRQPPARKQGKRDHTSVYRLLNAHRQSAGKVTVT